MARQNEVRYVNMYMSGSAAYQIEPVRKQKKFVRLPKAPRQKKIVIRLDPLTIVGFVVAVAMIVAMTAGVVQLNAAQQETAELVSYIDTLKNENAALEKTYRESYNLAEIGRYAEAMGLVPISQVEQLEISVQEPPAPEQNTPWEEFCIFLAGLFA